MVIHASSTILALAILTTAASAADTDPLAAAAQRIADQIQARPTGNYAAWFSPAFMQSVPEAQLVGIFQSMHAKQGAVVRIVPQAANTKTSGKFDFQFTGVQVTVTLAIDDAAPHSVSGLFFGPAVPRLRSLEEVKTRLAALPGTVSFQLQSLADGKPLLELNPDKSLAIGSAFKLYILAELVRQRTRWEKVVLVREELKSLPGGDMNTWPVGSPVTLHTLAVKMISQSDNTATDHLLVETGRTKVESALATLGMKNPGNNVPFLGTREFFQLKADEALRRQYLAADGAGRAALLATMAAKPRPGLEKFAGEGPMNIDQIEWFASSADLCRLMKWFDATGDKTALEILAINPGLPLAAATFPYIGFKGGSEPGVINLTFLLRDAGGRHLALAATWNNPAKAVDLQEFSGLVLAAVDLVDSPPTRPAK